LNVSEIQNSDPADEYALDISVIVPVTERPGSTTELHQKYQTALDKLGFTYEMIYVLDGHFPKIFDELKALRESGDDLIIVQLGKHFGEAAALEAGREVSRGKQILTLPAYYQFEVSELSKLFEDSDEWGMSVGWRYPRVDSRINQLLSSTFHGLVSWMTGTKFHDLSCGARLIDRQILDEIPLYGDQHRFAPVLAARRGFRVREIQMTQSVDEHFRRIPQLGIYPRRLLDLITVFFLVKFTKKPLRFFGLIGASCAAVGGLWTFVLVIQRLFLDQALAQRPALLLAALLIVLGVQLFALGLIGEIIIFTHARKIREYTIEKLIN